jgi:hypothetical protein
MTIGKDFQPIKYTLYSQSCHYPDHVHTYGHHVLHICMFLIVYDCYINITTKIKGVALFWYPKQDLGKKQNIKLNLFSSSIKLLLKQFVLYWQTSTIRHPISILYIVYYLAKHNNTSFDC